MDNFRPYVRSLRVRKAMNMVELFRSEWTFDPATSNLTLRRSYPAGGDYALRNGETLLLEVEFSEPMAAAELLAIEPAIGPQATLSSSQGPDERTLWTAPLTLAQIPRGPSEARLHLSGEDLAGTTLFPFTNDAPRHAPFNKRLNSSPIVDPTVDSVHVIPIKKGHRPAAPPVSQ